MAAHHRMKTGSGSRIHIARVMDQVDLDSVDLKIQFIRDLLRPSRAIIIAANGEHGSNGLERVDNLGLADVPGVDDDLAPSERSKRCWPHQTMGI